MKRNVQRHAVIQPLDSSYRIIPLTRGLSAIVDVDLFDYFMQWNWHSHGQLSHLYAARVEMPIRELFLMHREVLNIGDGEICDHINGNTLDNRRSNLRVATYQENCRNRAKHSLAKNPFKGVCKETYRDKWRAQIKVGPKRIHLGYFSTPEAAKLAYEQASQKYFGQFHRNSV